MKPFKGSFKKQVHDYWTRFMRAASEHKITRGAAEIVKIITSAHGDNWRRKQHVEKKPEEFHKK
jgi:hypothetical protein